MSPKKVKIANAQAFWGDSPDAMKQLIKQMPDLDFITLDYLAELSLSIMAIQMDKSPDLGFAHDFLQVMDDFTPFFNSGSKIRVVTNAGGLNPGGLAHACLERIEGELTRPLKIGIVSGDSVIDSIKDKNLVTANAYLGAGAIKELLDQGADIVITGRVTDPSLTVGCAQHHYNWDSQDLNKLSKATLAGHIIECGRQVTGGIATDWLTLQDQVNIPYPFVEIDEEGDFVVSKPPKTGGAVNKRTVTEQILYEIGDPKKYLSPDVVCDFSEVFLEELEKNRILVKGALGSAPSDTYKVSSTYRDGYKAEGSLVIYGSDAAIKAQKTADVLIKRLTALGCKFDKVLVERLGLGESVPIEHADDTETLECVLRIAVKSADKRSVECFCKEIASLVTSGPQGISGYTTGRPKVRKVYGYLPLSISKDEVFVETDILEIQP